MFHHKLFLDDRVPDLSRKPLVFNQPNLAITSKRSEEVRRKCGAISTKLHIPVMIVITCYSRDNAREDLLLRLSNSTNCSMHVVPSEAV